MLSTTDIEHGMGIFSRYTENITNVGYQYPIENGQYMITKPRLDESGETVTLWCTHTTQR